MRQITKIKCAGKWAEVWFDNKPRYTECCKLYMLLDCIGNAKLEDRLMSRGFVGLYLDWPIGADRPTSICEPWARFGTLGTD